MRRYFIPARETRAHALRQEALFVYAAFLFLVQFGLRHLAPVFPGVLGFASDITVEEVVNWTNRRRIESGLSVLTLDAALSQAAEAKARDMFEEDYWAHVSPSGTQPWAFITGSGYNYLYAGENLAKDFDRSEDVVEAWLASSTHRDNLMGENYADMGLAVVNGVLNGYETTLVVQMFGTPQQPVSEVAAAEPPPASLAPSSEPPITPAVPVNEVDRLGATELRGTEPLIPIVDVVRLAKSIAYTFGFFLLGLFITDGVTVIRRGSLSRLSGHTLAHLGVLVLLLGATWYTSVGSVL